MPASLNPLQYRGSPLTQMIELYLDDFRLNPLQYRGSPLTPQVNRKGIARSLVFCPIESWKMINDTGYPGLELALA